MDIPLVTVKTGPPGPASNSAPDPGGSSELFKSIEKLGLKLEPRREPIDVLVIDYAEKTPTEN